MSTARFPFVNHCKCFACNPQHPKGLRLTFFAPGEGRVRSEFSLSRDYVGLGSVVHGGIIATVFDDVMMWCLLRFRRRFYFTVQMEQLFLRPAIAGTALVAEASIEEDLPNRRVRLSSRLFAADEPAVILASGAATYAQIPAAMLSLLPHEQRSELEGILAVFEQQDTAAAPAAHAP